MKKIYFLFLMALLPLVASADPVEINGIYYNLTSKAKTATVTSSSNKYKGDVVIPRTVIYEGVKYSVTTIGWWAFRECFGLTSVTIPNGVTSIAVEAFYLCQDLESVTIPNSVTSIGEKAFRYCQSLKSVTIPNKVTSIYDKTFECCSSLTSVTIPNSVTTIDEGAFAGCSSLTSIAIPNSVTYIGWYAFSCCSSLTSVTIPNSVTTIGNYAFASCSSLTSVTIGNGIKTIDFKAFENCPELANVYCYAEKVPETQSNAFNKSYPEHITLHVPVGSLDAYKAAEPWNGFKNIVKITAKVSLSKSEAIIEKGMTVTLKATVTPSTLLDKSVTWKSSNTKVATVTSKGKVKGIKAGTATITCASKVSGKKATCKVTVVNGTVTLNKTEAYVEKGKTTTLKATLTPTDLSDKSVTWTSSDKSIATVSSSGKVKGVGYGIATITCTSNATGVSATCQVTVGKVVINMPEFTLRKTRSVTLKATIYPTTVTDKSVTWTSSDKSVATVTSSGKVKGIKAGTATITCTSVATGLSGTCTVTVLATSESRSTDGNDDNVTGIKELEENSVATEPYDVYDLSGRKVLNQTTTLDGLPAGVYIVNGRKVLKK